MAAIGCSAPLSWGGFWVPKRVLILYCSGGGGLLQAAIAKEQEIQKTDPSVQFVRRDMLKDWYWKLVGTYGVKKWDRAQRVGDIKTLEWLINCQRIQDLFFAPLIFYRALTTFFREKIDRVIDTQPLGTSAILFALRIYNWLCRKNIVLEKVVVDLPTKLNTHFFHPVKKLSKQKKKLLRLITIPPLLDSKEQTAEEFWDKHCGLSLDKIVYEYYPVRQSFRKFQGKDRVRETLSFEARFANAEEGELLSQAIRHGSLDAKIDKGHVRFLIAPQDRVMTLLLGSQPAFDATLGYIREAQKLLGECGDFGGAFHLFVLCAEHRPGEDSLLRRVAQLAAEGASKLNVIPLSFQSDEVIAPLFFRSDLTLTRSGGQTMMELMCSMRGEIWIHSESKNKPNQQGPLPLKERLRGIPGWEAGNALYLHTFFNAKVVTPEHCGEPFRELLQRWRSC